MFLVLLNVTMQEFHGLFKQQKSKAVVINLSVQRRHFREKERWTFSFSNRFKRRISVCEEHRAELLCVLPAVPRFHFISPTDTLCLESPRIGFQHTWLTSRNTEYTVYIYSVNAPNTLNCTLRIHRTMWHLPYYSSEVMWMESEFLFRKNKRAKSPVLILLLIFYDSEQKGHNKTMCLYGTTFY